MVRDEAGLGDCLGALAQGATLRRAGRCRRRRTRRRARRGAPATRPGYPGAWSARRASPSRVFWAEAPVPATATCLPAYRAATAGSVKSGMRVVDAVGVLGLAERGVAVGAERVRGAPGAGGVDDGAGQQPLRPAGPGTWTANGSVSRPASTSTVTAGAGHADDAVAVADRHLLGGVEGVGEGLEVASRPLGAGRVGVPVGRLQPAWPAASPRRGRRARARRRTAGRGPTRAPRRRRRLRPRGRRVRPRGRACAAAARPMGPAPMMTRGCGHGVCILDGSTVIDRCCRCNPDCIDQRSMEARFHRFRS